MLIENIVEIIPDHSYPFFYKYAGNFKDVRIKGSELILAIERFKVADLSIPKGPQQDHFGNIKPELKNLHVAISRAIEEGDSLKIGIVLGQTVSKLEELINQ